MQDKAKLPNFKIEIKLKSYNDTITPKNELKPFLNFPKINSSNASRNKLR